MKTLNGSERYIIRDREAGNNITFCNTLEEAIATFQDYEETDKRTDVFEEDFYEIYDRENHCVVDC